jgi:hypothetical protein
MVKGESETVFRFVRQGRCHVVILSTEVPMSAAVPAEFRILLYTTIIMTGDGSSKPQPDFVSLLKHYIKSTYRHFQKLPIHGKVSSS